MDTTYMAKHSKYKQHCSNQKSSITNGTLIVGGMDGYWLGFNGTLSMQNYRIFPVIFAGIVHQPGTLVPFHGIIYWNGLEQWACHCLAGTWHLIAGATISTTPQYYHLFTQGSPTVLFKCITATSIHEFNACWMTTNKKASLTPGKCVTAVCVCVISK